MTKVHCICISAGGGFRHSARKAHSSVGVESMERTGIESSKTTSFYSTVPQGTRSLRSLGMLWLGMTACCLRGRCSPAAQSALDIWGQLTASSHERRIGPSILNSVT